MKFKDPDKKDKENTTQTFPNRIKEFSGGWFLKSPEDFIIIGVNVIKLDCSNREIIENYLTDKRIDIMFLNECNMEKFNKKFKGYKSSIKEKCDMIYREELNCQQILKEDEDDYNITMKFEAEKQSNIIMVCYASPNDGHSDRIKKITNMLIKAKENYGESLKMIMLVT